MKRLKFDIWLHRPEVGGIMFSFTDGNGRYEETWFSSPPSYRQCSYKAIIPTGIDIKARSTLPN